MWSVLNRIIAGLLTVWAAATLGFFALAVLPGDAIESQLARGGVDADIIAERRAALGLTDPVIVRYGRFIASLLRGDLGMSLLSGEPVSDAILRNMPPTLTLAASALLIASSTGILLGITSALTLLHLSRLTRFITNLSLSMPIYWTGTIAIYVFTVQLGLLPSADAGRLSQLVLPVAVLGFHTSGVIARVTQSNLSAALAEDFVRTARSKGLPERWVIGVHAFRVVLPSVVAVIALQAGFLLSGTVITETLFVRPGIGRLLLDAVFQQDYPVVLGVVVLSAGIYSVVSFLADGVVRLVDPRVTR